MKKHLPIILLLFLSFTCNAETVQFSKAQALQLIVGSYVFGFNEFDTSVVGFDDSVRVGIYYDDTTQDKSRADSLAKRFQRTIPLQIEKYEWANGVKVIINVYSEDRTNRGY